MEFGESDRFTRAARAVVELLPLTTEIALESSRLPGRYHGDPADRILLATARITGARFMTKDEKLLDYGRQQHAKVVPA